MNTETLQYRILDLEQDLEDAKTERDEMVFCESENATLRRELSEAQKEIEFWRNKAQELMSEKLSKSVDSYEQTVEHFSNTLKDLRK